MVKFKCLNCSLILDGLDLVDYKCPVCHEKPTEMCENDHVCTCKDDVHDGIRYCEKCGKPTCPCGAEDVLCLSRVTGYIADIEGWRASKRQELKDRKRHEIT